MDTGTPKGLGQLGKGSLERELYRYTNITIFTQTGLNTFVTSEDDVEQHQGRFAKSCQGLRAEWMGELVNQCK